MTPSGATKTEEQIQQDNVQKMDDSLKAKGFSDPMRDALYIITPSMFHGSNWALGTLKNADDKAFFEAIKLEKNLQVARTSDGYVVLAPFAFMLETLKSLPAGMFDPVLLKGAEALKTRALTKYKKFLAAGKEGQIGIYNLNDSQTITINGETFPAFNLPISTIAEGLKHSGYAFVLNGQVVPVDAAMGKINSLMGSLKTAPSKNALLVTVKKVR